MKRKAIGLNDHSSDSDDSDDDFTDILMSDGENVRRLKIEFYLKKKKKKSKLISLSEKSYTLHT